jgi:hypothetical protein
MVYIVFLLTEWFLQLYSIYLILNSPIFMDLFGTKEAAFIKIIQSLATSVEALIQERLEHKCHCHYPKQGKAKHLTAVYAVVTDSSDIQLIFSNKNSNEMPQTITVLDGQNNVPGQLVPLAADGVTIEPISTINAGSESYTSSDPSIATAAPVAGGPEGSFLVTRVPGAIGNVAISYTAVNTDGTTISGSDNFVFQGPSTGVAASLTATYGPATA